MGDEHLGQVRHQVGDPVTRPDATRPQRPRHPLRLGRQLAVGEPPRAIDYSDLVRPYSRRPFQERQRRQCRIRNRIHTDLQGHADRVLDASLCEALLALPAGSPTHPPRCAFQVMTIPVLPLEAKVPMPAAGVLTCRSLRLAVRRRQGTADTRGGSCSPTRTPGAPLSLSAVGSGPITVPFRATKQHPPAGSAGYFAVRSAASSGRAHSLGVSVS